MTTPVIWHNPRCSKSRQTLGLLTERGIEPEIVLYLDTPPTKTDLRLVLGLLGWSPRQLMRTGEALYKGLGLADISDDDALLDAMVAYPKLIERPVVIANDQARLGRPPEQVLEIIEGL